MKFLKQKHVFITYFLRPSTIEHKQIMACGGGEYRILYIALQLPALVHLQEPSALV